MPVEASLIFRYNFHIKLILYSKANGERTLSDSWVNIDRQYHAWILGFAAYQKRFVQVKIDIFAAINVQRINQTSLQAPSSINITSEAMEFWEIS